MRPFGSFAQQQAGGGNGITVNLPTVDWTKLIPQILNVIGTWLNEQLHDAFDGLWSSGANVVGQTDLAMTWGFGPIHDQVVDIQNVARAVLLFALVLLGLKSMLGGLVRSHSDVIGEFVNGVLTSVILVAAFPLLIPQVIGLVNQAATAIGTADLSRYIALSVVPNPMLQLVLFVILLFFGTRLLFKAVWRIGFLAVLLPVGMAACALYAIPQTRWLLGWWARTWGGMLFAQLPSVLALTIGAQLFALGNGGLGAFVYSIAFLQLATDLYTLIPFGHGGGGGAPWGGLPWRAPLALLGEGPGATAAAIPANRVSTLAEQYGYQ
jgi:hypothetical protein